MADVKSFQRYIPEKELPDEIKALPRDETVCKFCGVSYLVHHEIKALENKVAELESYASKFAESQKTQERLTELVDGLKEKLENQNCEINQYKEWLADRDRQILQVKLNVDKLEADVVEKEQTIDSLKQCCRDAEEREESLKSKFLTVSKSLESLNLVCELAKLKEYVGGVTTQVEVLQKTLPTYSSKILSEVRCWQSRMDKERASLLERIEAEKATLAGVTDRLEEVKRERNRDITKLEALNKGLTARATHVQAERDELRHANTQLESQLRDAVSQLSQEKNNLQQDRALHNRERQRSEAEVERLAKELSHTRREHEEVLGQFSLEREQLKEKLKDWESQLKACSSELLTERTIRKQLDNDSRKQINELKQCLIDQENVWKEKLDMARKQHIQSTSELEHRLKTTQAQEMTALEEQFQHKLRHAEDSHLQALEHTERQYGVEIAKLKDQVNNACQGNSGELAALREELKKERLSGEAEMMSHIRQVKDLELRMKEMEDEKKQLLKKSRASAEEMRKEVEGLEENIRQLKGGLQDKDRQYRGVVKDLQETKSEISHLEATVQRECEERMELMEALSEAREQVLGHKRLSSSHSSRPTPAHVTRSVTPRESIEESRQRIASMTGRNKQAPSRGK